MLKGKQRTRSHEVNVPKWGNSNGVRLTKKVLEAAGIDPSENVVLDIEVEKNRISRVAKSQLTPFQKLFAGYTGGKPEAVALWDEVEPIEKEDW